MLLFSTTNAYANGVVRISDGVDLSSTELGINDEIEIKFTLRETEGTAASVQNLRIWVGNLRTNELTLIKDYGTVSFSAGESKSFTHRAQPVLSVGLTEGIYLMLVDSTGDDGRRINFDQIEGARNRSRFNVIPSTFSADGYVFSRTDRSELRWVSRSSDGTFGHTWIGEQCAQLLGGVSVSGSWAILQQRAPAGDQSVTNPCLGQANTNSVKLDFGVAISPATPKDNESFNVFFQLRETENTPQTFSTIKVIILNAGNEASSTFNNASIGAGEGRGYGATFNSDHGLQAGTYQVIVRYQLANESPMNFEAINDAANPKIFEIENSAFGTEGYVFSRTDTAELRWIGRTSSGEFGHIWIDQQCADTLGGVSSSGDWRQLLSLAPAGDKAVSNPCNGVPPVSNANESYVFGRTDKSELRWIGPTPSGELGHTWIDQQCADSLGGVSRNGDWSDLKELAPAGDKSVDSPC